MRVILYPETYDLLQLACKTLLLCMEGKEIQSHQKSVSPDIACRKSVESNSGAFIWTWWLLMSEHLSVRDELIVI